MIYLQRSFWGARMRKHGVSHGMSVLLCTMASGLLIDVVRDHMPVIYSMLRYVSGFIIYYTGLRFSIRGLSLLILASFLAMIWGMAFARIKR
jgi:hypothetical protein